MASRDVNGGEGVEEGVDGRKASEVEGEGEGGAVACVVEGRLSAGVSSCGVGA